MERGERRGPPPRENKGDPKRGDERVGMPQRGVAERVVLREGEVEPRPNGIYCNPLCPYFRCSNRSLDIRSTRAGTDVKAVAFCRWVGDQCIAGLCQYAYCVKRYLLPGNRCLYGVERSKKRDQQDIFRELDLEEREARKLREHLKKYSGRGLDLY